MWEWKASSARRTLATRVYRLILDEQINSPGVRLLRHLAAIAAVVYSAAMSCRDLLFCHGVLPKCKTECRVVCVGNITLGGTGKTPMVMWLARFLQQEGWKVAVVSRGYRGRYGGKVLVVSDGQAIRCEAAISGDEPQLLARRLPGVVVLCGSRRKEAVQVALQDFLCQVVVLDDGFQHRYLERDVDMVLLDSSSPYGNGRLFPRGLLREKITALERADLLVLSNFDGTLSARKTLEQLQQDWPQKPVFKGIHRPERLFHATTGEEKPLAFLRGKRLACFAGIAKPARFFQTVTSLGGVLAFTFSLPDHSPLTADLLQDMVDAARPRPAELWLTTEKDWVRLPAVLPEDLQLWVLGIEFDLGEDDQQVAAMVLKRLRA
ncbi:MAG: tetraacyldisaccharide 4'-kinase [Deltaproteobacteria bacterium]|nr:tetraacyldisaccharide 4'-kinase [Deltaproteobacteria bacterium]MBW2069990.1 tetraacyldisaccharide 4'-kinase [Deltaproteobacteria bacterium]